MQPEANRHYGTAPSAGRRLSPRARLSALWAAGLCTALLAACGALPKLRPNKAEAAPENATSQDREATAALLLASTIQTLEHLATATAAEQAEIVATARAAYERAPLGGAQLRYALVLGTQGYQARDPDRSRALLRELAAQPAQLQPVERAMTLLSLAQVERELGLKNENDRMQSEAQKGDSQRQAVANRRLQTAQEENARLKRQLEEAQAKLDAITAIERNVSGH